jgi:hypothetical protein
MIRPSRLFAPLLTAVLLTIASAPALAVPMGVEGRVLDHRRQPVPNHPVHVSTPCGSWTVYTASTGVFHAAADPGCGGYWYVTVASQTRVYLVTYGNGYVDTGDWILPASQCRQPCELAPPDDNGPFSVTPAGTTSGKPDEVTPPPPGDDDTPNRSGRGPGVGSGKPDEVDPGDDDMPNGEGDDDTPNAHGPPGFALQIASRNPFRGTVSMRLTVPRDTRGLEGGIYDTAGRRVRGIAVPATAGTHLLQWDGRDHQGALAKAGLYFVRVHGDLGRAGTTVVLLP